MRKQQRCRSEKEPGNFKRRRPTWLEGGDWEKQDSQGWMVRWKTGDLVGDDQQFTFYSEFNSKVNKGF